MSITTVAKKPYKPTLKQVLVRDFNWRMGNLRRLAMNCKVLDGDLERKAEYCVQVQTSREIESHQRRLNCVEGNTHPRTPDYIWDRAVQEVKHSGR